jgi:hypothetical protein
MSQINWRRRLYSLTNTIIQQYPNCNPISNRLIDPDVNKHPHRDIN